MVEKHNQITADSTVNPVTYQVVDRCLVIGLNQELDHHIASLIREKADHLIEKKGVRNIIFDFNKAGFMDSSGIGAIMGRYKRVYLTGGKVAVVNVNNTVDRIIRLSGLYKLVKRYASVDEAVHCLKRE